jgi:hypothetical protein
MQTYDVYCGIAHCASVCIQDDGRPVWTFDATWHPAWGETRIPTRIEEILAGAPRAAILFYAGFTLQRRPEQASLSKAHRPC